MSEWDYTGVNRSGQRVTGSVEASTEGELRMILRGQGVRPTRIGKKGALNSDIGALLRGFFGSGMPRVSSASLANFTRQMQVLVSSGIPLVQAIEILADQTPDPGLRSIGLACKERVSQGSFLWEALSNYIPSIPRVYVSMVRAGESAGALDTVLDRLAKYLDGTTKITRQVKSALTYPAFVVVIAVIVIGVMVGVVIPKFEEMLRQGGATLPFITQALISLSHFFVKHFLVIVGTVGTSVYLVLRYIKSDEGRAVYHRFLIRLPYFGEIVRLASVSRFTKTLGTLLGAGVNLMDALEIAKNSVDNIVVEEAVSRVRSEVEGGKQMAQAMLRISTFPRLASQMVAVGEATGNLEKMLDRCSEIYDADVEVRVAGVGKLIEPFMIVFLGGIIAVIMLAMYLPLFKLAGSSQGI